MILLNVYGKIEPLIVSKKLGVGISNPSDEWVSGLQDDLMEEMLLREHDVSVWEKTLESDNELNNFQPSDLIKAANWYAPSVNQSAELQIIAENLIVMQVLDFDNSYLRLKNDIMDSPTCEVAYPRKFINFCCMMQNAFSAKDTLQHSIPFCIYSIDELNKKPLILTYLSAMLNHNSNLEIYKENCISSLLRVGAAIDSFLESDEDFWKFDYIVNSMYFDHEYNAYHIFKVMSLIEMLIINPNGNGRTAGELERKLPQFSKGIRIANSKKSIFAEIMRKFRNKIAHGDFKAVQQLLERYRNEFMRNYQYDEFEYSIENWTYLNICCELDEILSEIVWQLITDEAKIRSIQFS